ncbi:MAG: hypothetical protein Q7K40_01730 [bacterium]|nr:hypothetical protein [bacterium]
MGQHSKKIFSVLFALLIGAGIIFFAWKGGGVTYLKDSSTTTNEEWKDTLSVIPEISPLKTLGFSGGVATGKNDATTTTSALARDLLVEYALTQTSAASTTLSDAEVGGIAQTLAERARANSTIKTYTEKDLHIVPASTSSLAIYQKEVSQALALFQKENTVNELRVVYEATQTKDASSLTVLATSVNAYQKLIKTLLALNIPKSVVPFHLLLLKSQATLVSGIQDMAQMLADPVRGMNGLATYQKGTQLVAQINKILSPK